ncbi:hypothetical protein CBL_03479 [Carabus blaptoides fortunei]
MLYAFQAAMCPSCGRLWTGLTVLWSLVYVCAGAVQIVTGIFLLISLPDLKLCSNVWAGSWNVVAGISGGMIACFGDPSPKRQERLLYVAMSILAVNTVNAVITEWTFYWTGELLPNEDARSHVKALVANARVTAGIAAAIILIASFLDSQFTFCSIGSTRSALRAKARKARGSHEQVSDIEYIIPRPKSHSEPKPTNSAYNAYAQSWVFEAETSNSNSNHAVSPYLKLNQDDESIVVNGKDVSSSDNAKEETIIIANPVVHIEEASDESTSNSDRKLCYMKSFSRTPSPVILSAASSQASLNNQPIYECLEKLTEPTMYRSRLNTALSVKDEPQYASTSPRKSEMSSPRASDPVQYASLMMELEQALTSKKDRNQSVMSPQSETQTTSDCSRHDSSKSESQKTDFKSSDADFSKELEAALQLIQDLESPNTAETPSETCRSAEGQRPLAVWRHSDASGSEKTLSAVGSLAELTSPMTECLPEMYGYGKTSTTSSAHGKDVCVVVQCSNSQSTSGYSSPTRKLTPNWSTSSSVDGSSNDLGRSLSFQIRNTNSSAVISLFPGSQQLELCSTPLPESQQHHHRIPNGFSTFRGSPQLAPKSVTVVKINGRDVDETFGVESNNIPSKTDEDIHTRVAAKSLLRRSSSASTWNVMSLLRKKKQIPKLSPELESAIIKSESLAHLTEVELLARHERNREIQRQIEQRVQQQLGQMTESNC